MDNRISQYHKALFDAQEKTVRMESAEGATEEQIQNRCIELRNIIIDNESLNNGFRNPRLSKIWASTRKKDNRFY